MTPVIAGRRPCSFGGRLDGGDPDGWAGEAVLVELWVWNRFGGLIVTLIIIDPASRSNVQTSRSFRAENLLESQGSRW